VPKNLRQRRSLRDPQGRNRVEDVIAEVKVDGAGWSGGDITIGGYKGEDIN
jgi:hypothetical protein